MFDRMVEARISRRSLLTAGALATARVLLPRRALARGRQPRELSFLNLHTDERLTAVYWDRGRYLPDALGEISTILRDHRTGEVHPVSRKLLDLLVLVKVALDVDATYEVISGYRSPETNAALHAADPRGVASRSMHLTGEAVDVRVAGRSLRQLRDAGLQLASGGVGYYPGRFVHLDVGRPRSW